VVDTVEVDFGFIGGGVFEGGRLEVILPVLIAKFKLRELFLLQLFFRGIELVDGLEEGGAVIIAALVDGKQGLFFPTV
jgi:hypothetical protein